MSPFARKAIHAAIVAAFAVGVTPASAAGLGRLTVESGLGQPLKAQVEITSLSREEASSLTARLADPDAFRQAGLEFNPALSGLRFEIQRTETDRPVIQIRSLRPVNEPFIDLLVELNWATGKFVREYTFLLDPPELQLGKADAVEGKGIAAPVAPAAVPPLVAVNPAAPVAVQNPTPVAAPPVPAAPSAPSVPSVAPSLVASPAAPAAVAAPAPTPRLRSVPPEVAPIRPVAQTHTVQRGETLAEIAEKARVGNVSLDQAIVAIYRKNPDAFFGSVHQLKAGVTLQMPSAAELAAVDFNDARSEMRRSNAEFRAYRAQLADQTREASKQATAEPAATAAVGSIAEATPPKPPAATAKDQLELSRKSESAGSATAGGTGSSEANTNANIEASIARDTALRNAQSRVSELERNVADLQRLLELKNKQLSDMSDRATKAPVAKPAPMADAGATSTPSTPMSPAVTAPVTMPSAPSTAATPTASSTTAGATTGSPASATGSTGAPSTAAPSADAAREAARAAQEVAAKAAAQSPAAAPKPAAKPMQAPVAAQEPESWVDTLLGNPYVPAGAAVLLGLLGLFAWKKRKKDDTEDRFEDTLGGDDAFAANSLFGTTGGHDVDTTNNSLFNSINAQGDGSTVDVHSTEVDPIAEAEVYIAYGREVQAEEILKEALKRQPERQAIRLKLLEIYGGRKDAGAYSSLAREMYDQTGGQNEEWPKVVTMGLSIDPDNPLYTGEAEHGPVTRSQPSGNAGSNIGSRAIAGAAAAAAGAAGLADAMGSKAGKGRHEDAQEANDHSDVLTQVGDRLEEADQPVGKLDDDFGALDFNLDTSIDMTQALDESTTSLKEGLGSSVDLPSLDLDSPMGKASGDMDELGLDIPSIDTLSGPATGHDASEIDLSSIGLDLASDGDTTAGSGEPARWQEMATKLDLASAYEEIGDKEGARELLEEVIKGGDNAQQQKAQAMLSKIS